MLYSVFVIITKFTFYVDCLFYNFRVNNMKSRFDFEKVNENLTILDDVDIDSVSSNNFLVILLRLRGCQKAINYLLKSILHTQ